MKERDIALYYLAKLREMQKDRWVLLVQELEDAELMMDEIDVAIAKVREEMKDDDRRKGNTGADA
ncbi:MAG: hypothetical protein LBU33_02150 [Endomicrobium sp.]|jgi:hypothetical protein|nr:hypothetical protein [Endomicrobium sp.]